MEATDGELLGRFLNHQDEMAFELLVRRHAALVTGVCRRVLNNPHDAEDAFQATFLVLHRKGNTMTQWKSISGWLYQVATRTALNLRKSRIADHLNPAVHGTPLETPVAEDRHSTVWEDLRPILDEELGGLSDRHRLPLILCYLEGKSYEHAAAELSLSYTTLKKRLERARNLLRERLVRRGVAASAPILLAFMQESASATVSPAVIQTTVQAVFSIQSAGIEAGAIISPQVFALAKAVLKLMFLQKVKAAALGVVTLAGLGALGTALTLRAAPDLPPAPAVAPTELTEIQPGPSTPAAVSLPTSPPARNRSCCVKVASLVKNGRACPSCLKACCKETAKQLVAHGEAKPCARCIPAGKTQQIPESATDPVAP